MKLRIVAIFICYSFMHCAPKVIVSAKNIDDAEIQMELKNLWVLLTDYRSAHSRFPQRLSDLYLIDHASLNKFVYTPNCSAVLIKFKSKQNGTLWLLNADGKIRKTLPESINQK